MKKAYFPILFLLCLSTSLQAQNNVDQALKSITPQELYDHVATLADDAFKGRDTPSPELDSAAAYIANAFDAAGLTAPNGSYYQTFNTLRARLGANNSLKLTMGGVESPYALKTDFVPLSETSNNKIINAPVIFAGYGITAPEYNYDDYAEIDATGKVVLIFTGEPQAKDSASVFSGAKATDYSKLRVKIENALQHGAVGLLLTGNPHRRFRRPPNYWPSLMRHAPEGGVPLKMETTSASHMVAVRIGAKLGAALMQGSETTLLKLFDAIDADCQPQSFAIPTASITMETQLDADRHPTHNVWAFLEGSDPVLKEELVVIGGHYDHVGVRNGQVYNGADDNASGTSGVIEIAEAFAMLDEKPKRSMLFMTFSGEEKGLFGSYWYTDHPLFPMEKTAAMFCMDMISRNDTNAVVVVGDQCSETLTATCESANETISMDMTKTSKWFFQSDHYPFYKKDVPVLFFNCGDTEDLHQPTDDVEKIIPEKMARIARLVFLTALKTANAKQRPDLIKFR